MKLTSLSLIVCLGLLCGTQVSGATTYEPMAGAKLPSNLTKINKEKFCRKHPEACVKDQTMKGKLGAPCPNPYSCPHNE